MSGAVAAVVASLYAPSGGGGGGLVLEDSASNSGSDVTTLSATIAAAGSDRYMPALIMINDFTGSANENGMTFNSDALTQVGTENTYGSGYVMRTSMFEITPPDAASASLTGLATTGPPFVFIVAGAAYSGANQTTPRGTVYTNSGTLGTGSASIGVAVSDALTGDTILAFVYCKDAAAGTPTLSAFNNSGAAIPGAVLTTTESMTMVEFTAAGDAPTVSMTLSTSNPDQVDWEIRAFKLNPA